MSESSPDLEHLKAEQDFRSSQESSAGLTPPAVLNAQYTAGSFPWKSSSFEGTYLWTFESGGKQDARQAAARASAASVGMEIEDRKARQLLTIALTQQVLKRLEARREILLETRETYTKLIQRYKRIPSRGPEQETSLAVIEIAKGENDLKIHALDVEEGAQLFQLAALSGCATIELPIQALVKLKSPVLDLDSPSEESSGRKRWEAESTALQLETQAELKSYASDVSIGPMVIAGHDRDKSVLEVGLAASIPLAGKRTSVLSATRVAQTRSRQAQIDLEIQRMTIGREAWKNQYKQAMAAMKSGLTNEEIARSHRKFEALFRSERISAALVIESHRQMLEHVVTYSELEAKAAEALWNLRYLDGKLSWSDL